MHLVHISCHAKHIIQNAKQNISKLFICYQKSAKPVNKCNNLTDKKIFPSSFDIVDLINRSKMNAHYFCVEIGLRLNKFQTVCIEMQFQMNNDVQN